jgi:hypothetical protein
MDSKSVGAGDFDPAFSRAEKRDRQNHRQDAEGHAAGCSPKEAAQQPEQFCVRPEKLIVSLARSHSPSELTQTWPEIAVTQPRFEPPPDLRGDYGNEGATKQTQ